MKEKFEKPKVKKIYNQRYVDRLKAKYNRLTQQVEELQKSKKVLTDENKNLADSIVLSLNAQTKNYKKLEQAKEIIKEMLPYMPKENTEGVYEIVTHAEEFIKE